MSRSALSIILAAALVLVSCSGSEKSRVQAPELLKAVPSDAISVSLLSRCEKGLEGVTDSSDVLRQLDFGHLSGAGAVLSKGNVGSVEQLLVIDAGHASADTSAAVVKVLDQVSDLGLYAAAVNDSLKRNVLLISRSETLVKLSLRHIEAGTSILDAPNFNKVLEESDLEDATVLRLSSARKLPSEAALENFMTRRRMADFLKGAADWLVVPNGGETCQLKTVAGESPKYFMNLVGALEPSRTSLPDILPESAEFAVCLAVSDVDDCRRAYDGWIDANSRTDKFKKALSQLRQSAGKDPLKWEKELQLKEVAKVQFGGGEVILVRPGRKVKAHGSEPYQYRGFASALYGGIFAIDDESTCTATRDWLVIGSEAAVQAFLEEGPKEIRQWPKSSSYVLWADGGILLSADKNSTVLINL